MPKNSEFLRRCNFSFEGKANLFEKKSTPKTKTPNYNNAIAIAFHL